MKPKMHRNKHVKLQNIASVLSDCFAKKNNKNLQTETITQDEMIDYYYSQFN